MSLANSIALFIGGVVIGGVESYFIISSVRKYIMKEEEIKSLKRRIEDLEHKEDTNILMPWRLWK